MAIHTEEAHMLKTVQMSVTEAAILAYAELSNDFNPIHVDPDFAARSSMGQPIAHGTMSLCLLWQCLQRNFGPEVFEDLQLELRFVKPIYVGDEIVAGGEAVSAIQDDLKVWIRGADGSDRIVGTALRKPFKNQEQGDEA